jgi:competence protein CoiA
MLTAIRTSDGYKIEARVSEKTDGPFQCPKCHREAIIRKGLVKIHHFAHKPPVLCSYGAGESELHRRCKQAIYDGLKAESGFDECELEKGFGRVVPDVYCRNRNVRIGIEVQISNLTMTEMIARTAEYNRLGIYILWLPLFTPALHLKQYAPKQWENWLHAVYFGRVYYWQERTSLVPIHFDEYQLYVEERSWYDSYGNEQSAGGYYRTSRRYRTPNHGSTVDLVKDSFEARDRAAWNGGDILVPKCKILMDKHPPWWKK